MLVQITRDTVAADRVVVIGEVVDLPDGEARVLLALGKAVLAVDAPALDTDAPAVMSLEGTAAPKRRR